MLFAMWSVAEDVWVMGHLLLLSLQDIRDRELSFAVLLEFLGTGLICAFFTGTEVCLWPGMTFLLLAAASGEKIGYGDGWLILGMGMWCPAEEIVSVLLMGCVLCTGAGILRKEKELPFVPFLTAGYIAGRYLL